MQNIEMRFSFDGLDLPGMQRGVSATIEAIENQVRKGIAAGKIDEELMRASLHALVHASARAQHEYESVRDQSLPEVWTAVTHNT